MRESKQQAMTLQQVHFETNCAEKVKTRKRRRGGDLRLDGLAEGPPLHLGLEAHVGDLQAEAVPVHGGRVVGSLDEGWPSIDWEEAGGTCSSASKLLSTAFPPTADPPLVAALVAGPYLEQPYLSSACFKVPEIIQSTGNVKKGLFLIKWMIFSTNI